MKEINNKILLMGISAWIAIIAIVCMSLSPITGDSDTGEVTETVVMSEELDDVFTEVYDTRDIEVPKSELELKSSEHDMVIDDKIMYVYPEEQRNIIHDYIMSISEDKGYDICYIFDVEEFEGETGLYTCIHMAFDEARYVCIALEEDNTIVPIYDCKLTKRLIENWEEV